MLSHVVAASFTVQSVIDIQVCVAAPGGDEKWQQFGVFSVPHGVQDLALCVGRACLGRRSLRVMLLPLLCRWLCAAAERNSTVTKE